MLAAAALSMFSIVTGKWKW